MTAKEKWAFTGRSVFDDGLYTWVRADADAWYRPTPLYAISVETFWEKP